jgi:hypothetical protein
VKKRLLDNATKLKSLEILPVPYYTYAYEEGFQLISSSKAITEENTLKVLKLRSIRGMIHCNNFIYRLLLSKSNNLNKNLCLTPYYAYIFNRVLYSSKAFVNPWQCGLKIKITYHDKILQHNISKSFSPSRQLLRKFSPATANGRSPSRLETRPPQ